MSKVRFPQLKKFQIVAFHYDPAKNPARVILQVPDTSFKSSSTYKINLDNAGDTAWLLSHKNGQQIVDVLKLKCHVAYRPELGEVEELEDRNEQTAIARLNPAYLQARRIADGGGQGSSENRRAWEILRRKKPQQ